jgi:hypothetical protein
VARFGSDDVGFLLVSGQNILGDSTNLEDTREAILEEITALGDAWQQHEYVGVKRYELTQQGFFNDATDRSNAALITPGASKVLSFAPQGNSLGKPMISSPMVQVNYARQLSRGALHKANASYVSEGSHDEGIILHALGAETAASGNTEGASSQDAGASSANGGGGVVQVTALALGGYTSVTFKVRHSSDDVTYADLVTFTNVTAAPAAERKTVTGTVNRHLACSWAFNGAGAANSVSFAVGFARF